MIPQNFLEFTKVGPSCTITACAPHINCTLTKSQQKPILPVTHNEIQHTLISLSVHQMDPLLPHFLVLIPISFPVYCEIVCHDGPWPWGTSTQVKDRRLETWHRGLRNLDQNKNMAGVRCFGCGTEFGFFKREVAIQPPLSFFLVSFLLYMWFHSVHVLGYCDIFPTDLFENYFFPTACLYALSNAFLQWLHFPLAPPS